jgi:hypothetical protein
VTADVPAGLVELPPRDQPHRADGAGGERSHRRSDGQRRLLDKRGSSGGCPTILVNWSSGHVTIVDHVPTSLQGRRSSLPPAWCR